MFKFVTVMLFVLIICIPAFAGPECKSYTMHYRGDVYTLDFSCETAGIGEVQTKFNVDEYTEWWLYFYVETSSYVCIPKLGSFELMDYTLYHIMYDSKTKKWYRTGLIFSDDTPKPEEDE
jgi:hypothetical protein